MKRRLDRLALWVLMTIGMCGCASARRAEVKVQEHETATVADKVVSHEVLTVARNEGPTHTVVEEFQPVAVGRPEVAVAPGEQGTGPRLLASVVAPGAPPTGQLIRRTTIDTGPVATEWHDEAEEERVRAARVQRELQEQEEIVSSLKPAGCATGALWALVPLALIGLLAWWRARS